MSGSLSALTTKWNTLSGTTVSKLQQINATQVTGALADISLDTINNYLVQHNRITALLAFVNNTPSAPVASALLAANYLVAILAGFDGATIKFSSSPTLLGILDNISADARTGVTAGDVTALNTAASPQVSWWSANGFSGPIQVSDLILAGNLS